MTASLDFQPTDILQTIRSRHSNGKVSDEVPSRETISQLLDAATCAPNHRLTQPWRFFVSTGDARLHLGKAMAQAQINREQLEGEDAQFVLDAAEKKVLRAPVILAVAVEPSSDPRVPEVEEICATAAATQNILLAAHALDLAAIWRTGDVCSSTEVLSHFGLSDRAQVIGFVYIGVLAEAGSSRPRRDAAELTTWLGW